MLPGEQDEVLQRVELVAVERGAVGEAAEDLVLPLLAEPGLRAVVGELLELPARAAHVGWRAEDDGIRGVERLPRALWDVAFGVDGDERSRCPVRDRLGDALGVAIARVVDDGGGDGFLGHVGVLMFEVGLGRVGAQPLDARPVGLLVDRQQGAKAPVAQVQAAPGQQAEQQREEFRRRSDLAEPHMRADRSAEKSRDEDRAEKGGGRNGIEEGADGHDCAQYRSNGRCESHFPQHARGQARDE